jgi:hypothetical protein
MKTISWHFPASAKMILVGHKAAAAAGGFSFFAER